MRTILVIIWALGCFAIVGCAGLGKKLEVPKITLVNLQVEKTTLFETTLKVAIRIINTNDIAFTLKGIDCELLLFEKRFATGVSNVVAEIPAYGSAIVPVYVYSSIVDMMKSIVNLKDSDRFKYEINGRIRIGGDALLPQVLPFTSEGELSIEDFPLNEHKQNEKQR
jgi:LEA14-like dessication related protein